MLIIIQNILKTVINLPIISILNKLNYVKVGGNYTLPAFRLHELHTILISKPLTNPFFLKSSRVAIIYIIGTRADFILNLFLNLCYGQDISPINPEVI